MMKKVFRARVIALPVLLVTSVIGTIGFIIRIIAQAQNEKDMSMNPIIMHIHPHLSILVNGKSIVVPEQVGIDPSLWKNHSLDEYGMQSMPEMNMSAWLLYIHTMTAGLFMWSLL